MKLLLATHDAVFATWVEALLAAEGIEAAMLDAEISNTYAGLDAFPRRMMVADKDWARARALLTEAGYGERLAEEPKGRRA